MTDPPPAPKENIVISKLAFFVSIGFSLVAWGLVAMRYIWPQLRGLQQSEALRRILVVHTFRFLGLAFLVPGIVSPDLPLSFAQPAAYGDLAAATLALLSLISLANGAGIVIAWIFNIWGAFDLLNAFYRAGSAGLIPGQLGATYFIPTFVVPMLLITHMIAFRILLRRRDRAIAHDSSAAA
ncbi:MAG: hypothetical protein ACJ79K_06360 [Gemmatimonadaceae bacterium]